MPPKKAKKQNGYQMAEFIKAGTQIKDAHKREWVVGEPVGQGGFGMIYLCDRLGTKNDIDNANYVIKIEPKQNGPLFTEINYYQRNCKSTDIDSFTKAHKMKVLGIPKFMSAGIHVYNKNELRYLIMPRFGRDLQKMFVENGTKFNKELIAQIATKILYALQYMHGRRYAHADIKGANILLGNEIKTTEKEELFLIDFGLAYLIPSNVQHKPDPRCKHDGTIEYCSTDAHDGSKPSFRGDIEILSWCLCHWASGDLPWVSLVKENMSEGDKEKVASKKREATRNPKKFLSQLDISDFKGIEALLSYSAKLDYADEVDFDKCRSFFKSSLPKGSKLCFTKVKSRKSFVSLKSAKVPLSTPKKEVPKKAPKSTKRRIRPIESSSDENLEPAPKKSSPNHEESVDISSNEDFIVPPPKGRSTRTSTRAFQTPSTRSTRSSKKEHVTVEIDSEVTLHLPKRNAKKGVRLPVPSSTIASKDSDEMNSSVASQSDFDASSISDDENEPPNESLHSYYINATKDETNALLGLDDSSSIIEEENEEEEYTSALSILKEKRINRFETTVNHPKTKKIMKQPGKLVNPVDASTQTFRRTGAIKSFMKENPEKREKLRQWLRGERDHFR